MLKERNPLLLPALRAHMGDWVYYIAMMKLTDIAERVQFAKDIHKSEKLNEFIQRNLLTSRADDIAEYLVNQPQRLFNSIIVGVYGGEPQWLEAVRSREGFLEGLGRLDDPRVLPGLTRRLKAASASDSASAARGLGHLRDRRATRTLAGLLRHRSTQVQLAAIDALEEIKDPAAIEPLRRRARSRDERIRTAARGAIASIRGFPWSYLEWLTWVWFDWFGRRR